MQHNDCLWRKECLHEPKTEDLLHRGAEGDDVAAIYDGISPLNKIFTAADLVDGVWPFFGQQAIERGDDPLNINIRQWSIR